MQQAQALERAMATTAKAEGEIRRLKENKGKPKARVEGGEVEGEEEAAQGKAMETMNSAASDRIEARETPFSPSYASQRNADVRVKKSMLPFSTLNKPMTLSHRKSCEPSCVNTTVLTRAL